MTQTSLDVERRKKKQFSLPAVLAVVVIACGSPTPGNDGGSVDGGTIADSGYSDGGCDCGGVCPPQDCFQLATDGGDGGTCQCLV